MKATAAERLTAKGIRPTPQRLAVYTYLCEHPTHPSAETIYRALQPHMPALSLTTVYNCLSVFSDAGLVRTVDIRSQEQCFDADIRDHGHFLCERCGTIYDFSVDESLLNALCPSGFCGQKNDLYIRGVCAHCATEAVKPLQNK